MDKDITGFGEMLNSWIPSKVQEKLNPVVDKAENTVQELNGIVRNTIRNNVSQIDAKTQSLNNQIMDRIDSKITPIEGRIDALNSKILNKIETPLFPIESKTNIGTGLICDTTPVPIGGGRCVVDVCDPATGITVGQQNIPCPNGNAVGGGLIDNQECPPIPECPPQKDCPPIACIYVDLWRRWCKENQDNCLYFTLSGYGPLSKNDHSIATELTCDQDAMKLWENALPDCEAVKACQFIVGGGNGNDHSCFSKDKSCLSEACQKFMECIQHAIDNFNEQDCPDCNQLSGSLQDCINNYASDSGFPKPCSTTPSTSSSSTNGTPTDCQYGGDYSRALSDCLDDQAPKDMNRKLMDTTLEEILGGLSPLQFVEQLNGLQTDMSVPIIDFDASEEEPILSAGV